jgi:hypothetical protein
MPQQYGAKKRAELERRLECLAVEVLTALAEHGAVREAERRAGDALRTMIDDEGLPVRQAADCAAVASQCGRSPGYASSRTTTLTVSAGD